MASNATAYADYPGRPNHRLRLFVRRDQTDVANNRSTYAWELIAERMSGAVSYALDALPFSANVAGQITNGSHHLDFRNTSSISLRQGVTGWLNHDSNGYLNLWFSANHGGSIFGVAQTPTVQLSADRIPKPPAAPGTPTLSNITPTSVRVTVNAPNNNGAAINLYQFQRATNAAMTANVVTTSNTGRIHDLTGIPPGSTYWFRVRARNSQGWGAWSPTVSRMLGLPAPTLVSWAQNATGGLVATWQAPSITSGLTGYRLQIASDAGFTQNVRNINVGNVLTHTRTGETGGRRYWARVAARTAGGVNTHSGSLNTMLVLAAGDLNGWSRVGTKPAAITYFTSDGLRRGVTGSRSALWIESLSTGPVTLQAGVFGMQRTLTTTPGKSYQVSLSLTGGFTANPTAAQGRTYHLTAGGITGDPVTLTMATETVDLRVEFVADDTTTVLRLMLAGTVAVPAAQDVVERIAVHNISVLELASEYPQRLRSTVYESNLANHFDLACNSVGASWLVDKTGLTRFILPGAALPVDAVFSDTRGEGLLEYTDIKVAYDTRSMANRLDATNHGIGDDGLADDTTVVHTNPQSISLYGERAETVNVNLYTEPPYQGAFEARLTEILDTHDQPELLISSITWNAQQDLYAAADLDVGQRVYVEYMGTVQDSQIVSLAHTITPTRWMITAQLLKL